MLWVNGNWTEHVEVGIGQRYSTYILYREVSLFRVSFIERGSTALVRSSFLTSNSWSPVRMGRYGAWPRVRLLTWHNWVWVWPANGPSLHRRGWLQFRLQTSCTTHTPRRRWRNCWAVAGRWPVTMGWVGHAQVRWHVTCQKLGDSHRQVKWLVTCKLGDMTHRRPVTCSKSIVDCIHMLIHSGSSITCGSGMDVLALGGLCFGLALGWDDYWTRMPMNICSNWRGHSFWSELWALCSRPD